MKHIALLLIAAGTCFADPAADLKPWVGSWWTFNSKSEKLGTVQLLEGGGVKSDTYQGFTWHLKDSDTLEWISPKGVSMTLKFDSAKRDKLTGKNAGGATRWLIKTSPTANPNSTPTKSVFGTPER